MKRGIPSDPRGAFWYLSLVKTGLYALAGEAVLSHLDLFNVRPLLGSHKALFVLVFLLELYVWMLPAHYWMFGPDGDDAKLGGSIFLWLNLITVVSGLAGGLAIFCAIYVPLDLLGLNELARGFGRLILNR